VWAFLSYPLIKHGTGKSPIDDALLFEWPCDALRRGFPFKPRFPEGKGCWVPWARRSQINLPYLRTETDPLAKRNIVREDA